MSMEQMSGGALYFLTNAVDGKNEVVMLQRAADGSLRQAGAYATGGSGAGPGPDAPFADPLGSQGALALDPAHNWLFAVNAGSNEVSSFRRQAAGLQLVDKVASGGNFPVSLTVHNDLLYVLNAGGDGHIMGFLIQADGKLMALNDSRRALGVGGKEPPYVFNAPGHVLFSPDGRWLVVVEKGIRPEEHATHKLHLFSVGADGLPSMQPTTTISHGHFPFAATFTDTGHLVVVEVFGHGPIEKNTGAISSYAVRPDGSLHVISGTVDNMQGASCWIVAVAPYLYVTNFMSHTISGYRLNDQGEAKLLHPNGLTASTGESSHPVDLAATADGRLLYVLLPGKSQVGSFAINADGSLTSLGVIEGNWPIYSQGLVVV
jgi:6-phosphogluconolactonase (cycloisomerase 2 family)